MFQNILKPSPIKICLSLILFISFILDVIHAADILPLSQKPIDPYSINVGEHTYYKFYFRTSTLIQVEPHIKITFPKEFEAGPIAASNSTI